MSDTPQLLLAHHLKALRLPSFLREYDKLAQQCAAEGVDHPRYLLRLAELELIDREQRMVERRIKEARFPTVKSLDSFEFAAIPSLNKTLVLELARCEYVARRENVIAVGNSGTGKTHIALGLGLAACQKGLSVGFVTAAALVHELIEARDEKRLLRLQRQREIRLPDNEVRYAGVTPRTDYRDGFTAAPVKRIEDPNLNRRTPGSMTLLRPAWANLGLLVPSVTRLAATTARSSISGFPSCSPNSRSPAVTAAMPASCAVSPASSSSSSTIGASNRSTPAPVVTSTRSSRNAMGVARPSSPVRSRSTSGTPSLATRLTPMPSSTGSFTTLTASISPARV